MYVREVFQYLKKSFWLIILLALPAAVALAFFTKPVPSFSFIPEYIGTEVNSFYDVLFLIINRDMLKYVYPYIVSFLAILISVCIISSVIEKHLRTGKLSLKRPLSQINNTFLPVLFTLLLMTAALIIAYFLLSGLTLLIHLVTGSWGDKPNIAAIITVLIVSIVVIFLYAVLFGPLVFLIPIMSIYGYSFSDSIAKSYALLGSKKASIIFSGMFPVIVIGIIEFIISFFTVPFYAQVLYRTALYTFFIAYICPFFMIVMFDRTGMERKDLKTYFR